MQNIEKSTIHLFTLFKNGPSRPLLHLFSVFQNKQYNFYNKSMCKNVHPVYSAGIRTYDLQIVSHTP